jgi:hypothetical protein
MSATGAGTVGELFEQLARRRCRAAVWSCEQALWDPERASVLLGEMAVALEDAAAVVTVIAGRCQALSIVRREMDAQASALVTLAGRLEEAADLGRR